VGELPKEKEKKRGEGNALKTKLPQLRQRQKYQMSSGKRDDSSRTVKTRNYRKLREGGSSTAVVEVCSNISILKPQ